MAALSPFMVLAQLVLSTLLILNFHIEKSLLVTLLDFLVLHKPATVRKPLSLNYISQ